MKKLIKLLILTTVMMMALTACGRAAPSPGPASLPASGSGPVSASAESGSALGNAQSASGEADRSSSPADGSYAPAQEEQPLPEVPETNAPGMEENGVGSTAPVPVDDSREFNRGKANRDGLQIYLEESLTLDQYTYFYYTEDQLGLGIATPDKEAVKAAVESYGHPEIEVEYRETAYPKSILDKAHEELREFRIQADREGEQIVMNTAYGGGEGYIDITIHEMHPALEKFLLESRYSDCFRVEVTGGEPLFNPDT